MPNIKSAEKRDRTSEVRRQRNAANKSRLNTARRHFLETLATNDKDKSREQFNAFCSMLDKSAKNGAISRNAADRRKARAFAKLAALQG
jgi:small subunit ribosomal protein S20